MSGDNMKNMPQLHFNNEFQIKTITNQTPNDQNNSMITFDFVEVHM